jgi:hypothetical protein
MAPRVAAGQTAPAAPAPPRPLERNIIVLPGDIDERRAEDIRRAFQEVMRRYPPALGRVLKLDPTLLTNQAYLAPYPALAEFLRLHPEVARYSGYFLSYVSENGNSWEPQDADQRVRSQALDMWRSMIGDLGAFSVFLVVTAALVWLVKYFVGHRRWLRTTKVQSEVHNRLLERFSSNDELMAYVQSPAGEHFLQAMPVAIESSDAPALAAPLSRILWSVQVGLVLAAGGIGMLIIRDNLIEEVSQMLMVLGTLAISLGIGFSLAALASYLLSSRLGLLNRPTPGPRGDAPLG